MSIEQTLSQALKDAMRSRDPGRVACIRQIKARVQEAQNAEGFSGTLDDAMYQQVIGSYIKQLKKGMVQMDANSERGQTLISQYRAEVDYLRAYLPQPKDEAATRQLVCQALADTGVTDTKQAGQVVGLLIKQHADTLDVGLTKRLVIEALSQAPAALT